MNRIQTTALFAALFFLVGLLSGNFMAPGVKSQTETLAIASASETMAFDGVIPLMMEARSTQTNSEHSPDDALPQQVGDGSFSEFAEAHVTSTEFIADIHQDDMPADTFAASELTEASEADVLASIELYFPELPTHVKSGWVDTYSGMPLGELNVLLEQKKSMPSILQVSNSFFPPGADANIQPVERIQQNLISHLRSTVIENLRNASTVGYRRRSTNTSLAEPTPEASPDRITTSTTAFDFTPGAIVVSHNNLHVAIQQDPLAMFRLEPGCVLTRNGQFERLDDGRIGVRSETVSLALSGLDAIPLEAVNITIAVDGTVRYKHGKIMKSAGKISLVRVSVTESLTSENGVYFSLPPDICDEHLVSADHATLVFNAFEDSNVVLDQEWQLLDHFERLQTLQDSSPASGREFTARNVSASAKK